MIKRTKFIHQEKYPFQLIETEQKGSLGLAISGAGYHTDLPVFYYLSQLVAIHAGPVLQAVTSKVKKEIIEEVFTKYNLQYKPLNHIILAKSAGTRKASYLLKNIDWFSTTSIIWLTPLIGNTDLFDHLMAINNPSLIVIGTRDRHYDEEKLTQLGNRENIYLHIIEGATHSLEYMDKGNVEKSIEILNGIVKASRTFLNF